MSAEGIEFVFVPLNQLELNEWFLLIIELFSYIWIN